MLLLNVIEAGSVGAVGQLGKGEGQEGRTAFDESGRSVDDWDGVGACESRKEGEDKEGGDGGDHHVWL